MSLYSGNTSRLKVALAEMSGRERSMLEFFFTQKLDKRVQLVSESAADVVVFDLDSPGAMQHWEAFADEQAGYALGISYQRPERETERSAWVEKPLASANMRKALEKLSGMIDADRDTSEQTATESVTLEQAVPDQLHQAKPVLEQSPTFTGRDWPEVIPEEPMADPLSEPMPVVEDLTPASIPVPKRTISNRKKPAESPITACGPRISAEEPGSCPAPNHQRVRGVNILSLSATQEDLCGKRRDVDLDDWGKCIALYYLVENYFQTGVEKAWRLAVSEQKPVLLSALGEKIAFFPNDNEICTTIREDALIDLCNLKVRSDQLEIKTLTGDEAHYYHIKRKITTSYVLQADAFVWLVALLSSRGRIPKGVDMDRPVCMTRWPNLTRMVTTPEMMKIAALWASRQVSLRDAPAVLGVPQRYVFAFFSAAYAIDLVKLGALPEQLKEAPREKAEGGSLFARLLSHLPVDGRDAA